jgi:hypothetical protein
MLSSRGQISKVSPIRLLSILTDGRSKLDLDWDRNDDHRRVNLIGRRHDGLSFLITLSAIVELQRDHQKATGFEDVYFFGASFLRCFGLFVGDAQCNRRKGIVLFGSARDSG